MSQPRYLLALQGRVFLNRPNINGHVCDHETDFWTKRQCPQFLPRIYWPQPPYTFESRYHLGRYDTNYKDPAASNPELGLEPDLKREEEISRASHDYRSQGKAPYLKEHGYFADQFNGNSVYRGMRWHEHVTHCHNMLLTLHEAQYGQSTGAPNPRGRWLTNVQMQSLLSIVSYGLSANVYFMQTEFLLRGAQNGWLLETEAVEEFGYQRLARGDVMSETEFMVNDQVRDEVRKDLDKRRWVVVPVMAEFNHWCMTFFDRKESELYILDTAGRGREKRVEGICHLWARFWNRIGLPYHFRYYAPPTREQLGSWECGYLGVAWIMRNLRDGVHDFFVNPWAEGRSLQTRRHDIYIGDDDPLFPEKQSQGLSDWQPRGYPSRVVQEGMMTTMLALLCNELGISDHPSMLAPPPSKMLEGFAADGLGAYDRILKTGWFMRRQMEDYPDYRHEPQIPWRHFWTISGGPQFAWGTALDTISPHPTHSVDSYYRASHPTRTAFQKCDSATLYQRQHPGPELEKWRDCVKSFTRENPLTHKNSTKVHSEADASSLARRRESVCQRLKPQPPDRPTLTDPWNNTAGNLGPRPRTAAGGPSYPSSRPRETAPQPVLKLRMDQADQTGSQKPPVGSNTSRMTGSHAHNDNRSHATGSAVNKGSAPDVVPSEQQPSGRPVAGANLALPANPLPVPPVTRIASPVQVPPKPAPPPPQPPSQRPRRERRKPTPFGGSLTWEEFDEAKSASRDRSQQKSGKRKRTKDDEADEVAHDPQKPAPKAQRVEEVKTQAVQTASRTVIVKRKPPPSPKPKRKRTARNKQKK